MTQQISCDAHDYFEIVAMRKSLVSVTTFSGNEVRGIANDIVRIDEQEQLELLVDNAKQHIKLTDIAQLKAEGNRMVQHNFTVDFS